MPHTRVDDYRKGSHSTLSINVFSGYERHDLILSWLIVLSIPFITPVVNNINIFQISIYSVLIRPKGRPKRVSAPCRNFFMTQLPASFAVKGLLISMTRSFVATGLAHSILIVWFDQMLTRRQLSLLRRRQKAKRYLQCTDEYWWGPNSGQNARLH